MIVSSGPGCTRQPAEIDYAASELRRSVKFVGVLLAILFLGLLVFGVTSRATDTTLDDAIAAGRPAQATDFSLDALTAGRDPSPAVARAFVDGRVELSELRGRPIVVNLWASWCEPCREEAPALRGAWRLMRPTGAVLLGLDQRDVRSDALGFLRKERAEYPSVRDPDDDTARAWGATGIPETYFLDRNGRVVAHVPGVIDAGQLDRGLAAARTGRPVLLPRTGAASAGNG